MLCLTCTLGNSSARKAVTYWEALSVSLVLICSNYDLRRKSLCPPPQLWLHFSAEDDNLNQNLYYLIIFLHKLQLFINYMQFQRKRFLKKFFSKDIYVKRLPFPCPGDYNLSKLKSTLYNSSQFTLYNSSQFLLQFIIAEEET